MKETHSTDCQEPGREFRGMSESVKGYMEHSGQGSGNRKQLRVHNVP